MTESPAIDPDDRQQCGIQVIARMSRIMRVLSAHGQPCGMSLAAIAAEVELPRSTVQRIINALVVENIVEPAGSTGFRIGPAL
ncbi:MAG: helix-turn-helix domain-containing protein, partial [Comamonadaceae bacterium]|nr:helix-turn-helix domain-containing protein [Comamonadaceae bacterium]